MSEFDFEAVLRQPHVAAIEEALGSDAVPIEIIKSYHERIAGIAAGLCVGRNVETAWIGSLEQMQVVSAPVPYYALNGAQGSIGLALRTGRRMLFDAEPTEAVLLGNFVPNHRDGTDKFAPQMELYPDEIRTCNLQALRINNPGDLHAMMDSAYYIRDQLQEAA